MNTCKICKKEFCSSQRLHTHLNRKFKCDKNQTVIVPSQLDLKKPEDSQLDLRKPEDSQEKLLNFGEKMSKNVQTLLKCEYCDRNFTRIDNLNVHKKKYCKSIKTLNNDIIHELKDKVKELEDKLIVSNITTNNTTNNTNTTNTTTNNNSTNNIINNIINFGDLNYDIDKEFIYNCLKAGINGDIDYLRKVYLEDIPHECRSIKCLDPSRDKCVVRKNGEWIASTGKDIYRQSLKKLANHYLRVNNCMLDSNCYDSDDDKSDISKDEYTTDIEEYINTYSESDNIDSNNNEKIDEYMSNLNRITHMMDTRNVHKVSKHMNILLK